MLLAPGWVAARHIIGGELTYRCLGFTNNDPSTNSRTYQVFMNIYRDCLGGGDTFDSAPGSTIAASVTVYAAGTATPVLVRYLPAPVATAVDPNPGNACVEVPSNVCVEQGAYELPLLDLPIIGESYFIVYQRCCRNETLTNITDPAISGATYLLEITPEAQQLCNNSPVFNSFPPFVICAGEALEIDLSATDADGHRLEYSLCTPFLGGGPDNGMPADPNGIAPDPDAAPPFQPVNFIQPEYSAEQPLGSQSAFSLDPNTGLLTGVPATTGQFVVGVCVSDYAPDGTLLGTVRRDFQFLVTNCERNVVADLRNDGLTPDGTFVVNSCTPTDVLFENRSYKEEFIDDVRWEFDINGVTETYTDWGPTVSFDAPGQYVGRLVLSSATGCTVTGDIQVNILSEITAAFEVAGDSCSNDPLQFLNNSVTGPGTVSWRWDFDDGNTSTQREPLHQYTTASFREVTLRVEDQNGCVDSTSQTIAFFPVPRSTTITRSLNEGCAPETVDFALVLSSINEQYAIAWDFGDGNSAFIARPSHTYEQPGTYPVRVTVEAPNGCRLDSLLDPPLILLERPQAGFSFDPLQPTSLDPEVRFTDESRLAAQYQWDFGGLGASTDPNPVFTFPDTGSHLVVLEVTHANGCTDTFSQLIAIESLIAFYLPNAFSPNEDGNNDEFKGYGPLGGKRDFQMLIFDRWGNQVFETEDPARGWNGQWLNTGDPLPEGVYVYLVTFIGPEDQLVKLKGMVTLVR